MTKIRKAFTLIELLVVIGVLAVIAAGVVAVIDPVEKTRQANDAKVQNDIGQFVGAVQAIAASNPNGSFPCSAPGTNCPNQVAAAVMTNPNNFAAIGPNGSGDLRTIPAPPQGGQYLYYADPGGNATQTAARLWGRLQSRKYNTAVCAAGTVGWWAWDSATGRICGACAIAAPVTGTTITCTF